METFWTSDSHYFHANVIRFCNRPYSSVDEMNENLIERWNSVVSPNDEVYHLGDFAFRQSNGDTVKVFSRLNGKIHLIRGNHDKGDVFQQNWASVSDYKELKINHRKIVMSHYPMRSWNGMYHNSLHLYGHVHGNIADYSNCMDVGVDKWNYYPVTLEQIMERSTSLTPWQAGMNDLTDKIED
jgi:calcineurin-like phosphoesterase family protein